MRKGGLLLASGLTLALLYSSGVRVQVQPPTPAFSREVADVRSLSAAFVDVSDKVLPAVVSIDAIKVLPGYRFPLDPFFPFTEQGLTPEQHIPSVGSGLIVRPDGYIITNNHVVDGVREIRVTFSDGRVAGARLIGSDAASDLAVLKVDGKGLPTLPWGDGQQAKIGEIVLAFGTPFHMSGSVSHGIISGKGRKDLGIADLENYIQTDAAINPGNSGGPLVDLDGKVIGLNAAILSKSGGSQGIGLAIPSETVRQVMEELIASGRVERSWIGMFVVPIEQAAARQLRLPDAHSGVLVQGGYRDSPSGKAGFRRYDAILEFDGVKIKDDRQLRAMLAKTPVGKPIPVMVWREGQLLQLTITPQLRPLDQSGSPARGI